MNIFKLSPNFKHVFRAYAYVSEMREIFRKRKCARPPFASQLKPPSLSSSTTTDGQTTWPGEQRRGKRAVSLGQQRQQQQQQQQPQQSWVLQGDQLCPEERHWISLGRLATLGMSVCFVQWGKNPLHPVEEAKWLMAGFEKLALPKRCTWNTSQCLEIQTHNLEKLYDGKFKLIWSWMAAYIIYSRLECLPLTLLFSKNHVIWRAQIGMILLSYDSILFSAKIFSTLAHMWLCPETPWPRFSQRTQPPNQNWIFCWGKLVVKFHPSEIERFLAQAWISTSVKNGIELAIQNLIFLV